MIGEDELESHLGQAEQAQPRSISVTPLLGGHINYDGDSPILVIGGEKITTLKDYLFSLDKLRPYISDETYKWLLKRATYGYTRFDSFVEWLAKNDGPAYKEMGTIEGANIEKATEAGLEQWLKTMEELERPAKKQRANTLLTRQQANRETRELIFAFELKPENFFPSSLLTQLKNTREATVSLSENFPTQLLQGYSEAQDLLSKNRIEIHWQRIGLFWDLLKILSIQIANSAAVFLYPSEKLESIEPYIDDNLTGKYILRFRVVLEGNKKIDYEKLRRRVKK